MGGCLCSQLFEMFSNCFFFFRFVRAVAYRWLVRWICGYLGWDNTRPLPACVCVLLFMSFQLVFVYLFYLFIYLFISSFCLFLLTNSLLSPSFSANLPSVLKHYLVLLSSISFIVILSKHYLFFVLMYYIVKVNFFSFSIW